MSEQRGTKAEIRKLRQELGLCIDCGDPIEPVERSYRLPPIRCAACRERETQRKYALKRIREQQEARRAEEERRTRIDYMPPRAICGTCVWATYTGEGWNPSGIPSLRQSRRPPTAKSKILSRRRGVYFCPLSVCIRVKLSDILNTQDSNALEGAEAQRLESRRDSKSAAKPQTADGKIKDFVAAP